MAEDFEYVDTGPAATYDTIDADSDSLDGTYSKV